MPDDQGNFQPGGLSVRGRGGELRYGFRIVSELGRWTAEIKEADQEGTSMTIRMTVRDHESDSFWLEHAPEDEIELEMRLGSREMRGPAKILNKVPNLVVEARVE